MLKLQFTHDNKKPIWAMEKSFAIGRDSTNHLIIDSPDVASHHAKLLQRDDVFILKDMGSKTGTQVNGQRITQKNITCGDKLRFGDIELEVIDPFEGQPSNYWSLIADANWLSGQEFPLNFTPREQTLMLGRGNDCDIVIPGTHLSRHHAELSLTGDNTIALKDLNSANGTFVNEHAVSFKEIKAGDRLRFDVYSFRLFGPEINLPKAATLQRATQHTEQYTIQRTQQSSSSFTSSKKEAQIDLASTLGNGFNTSRLNAEDIRWKTKPTSVGNREEVNLYKKNWASTILAVAIVAMFIAFMIYLISSV